MDFLLHDHSTNTRTTVSVSADPVTIGRDADCAIPLRSTFVSRKHAQIVRKGNQMFVETLSRSGTRVSNMEVQIGRPVRIDFGDEVQIAQYSIAALSPGKRVQQSDDRRELHRKLMAFEQKIHADLLTRMNLRVTGHINKNDANFSAQVVEHLRQILTEQLPRMEHELIVHTVYTNLHRLTIAEVVRQCQGKFQTDYQAGDERLRDPERDKMTTELVTSMVDLMSLKFDPTSVTEDLTTAESEFEELFPRFLPNITKSLAQYMVIRLISKDLLDIMFGLGPLQDLLEMANVSEIMVVGKDRIYVEKNGVIQPTTRSFFSDEVLLSVVERILTPVGRRVDTSTPLVDARLLDGSRINVIISPLSLVGPCLTIRKFGWIPFTIDDLIQRGSISEQCAEFLQGCVVGRQNIIICGGTGSGKTTLLNVLSAHARPSERIITIEESAELKLPQPHVVVLEGRPVNIEGKGGYTIRELVRNSLRMRPDRIIVGEVRGPEALDMLQAMNTGHDGSLSTVHANTPGDGMKRLETLVLMAVDMPVRAIREQITSAVDLVVQISRFANGRRRVTHITEVTAIDPESGQIRVEDIFVLRDQDQPRLRHTGYVPTFAKELIAKNIIDVKVFL
jgi:Flp pilus assembly CpaF family ATPase/pSer/pThr/pTyr-binding forkhead associated (FHA) protein